MWVFEYSWSSFFGSANKNLDSSFTVILSSVISFSSCLLSFSASGSFSMSQLFSSGGQSIGASASASVLPMNMQCWKGLFPVPQFLSFRMERLDLLAVQGTLKSLLQHSDSVHNAHYIYCPEHHPVVPFMKCPSGQNVNVQGHTLQCECCPPKVALSCCIAINCSLVSILH